MPGTGGGGTADPHITRFDGATFDFNGRPGATYRLFEHGPTQVRCTLRGMPGAGSDPKTIIADLTITVGTLEVAIPLDGQIRISSPAFSAVVHALICQLPAHRPGLAHHDDAMRETEYFNVQVTHRPDDLAGATGLWVDGDGSEECEARHLLHDPGA